MPRGNPLAYFGSVINTASTRYLDDAGNAAFERSKENGSDWRTCKKLSYARTIWWP